MSSNLKVNSLVPATGTAIGIGTTGGSIDFRCPATFGGNVTIGGTLTYDEVINIDSIGIVTARSGLKVTGGQLDVGSNIKAGNAGVITATSFSGSGASLTNLNASNIASGTVPTARLGSGTASSSTFLAGDSTYKTVSGTTINNNANNRIVTGSGTANTLEAETTLEWNGTNTLTAVNQGSGYPDFIFTIKTVAGGGESERFRVGNGPFRINNTNYSQNSDADALVLGTTSGDRGITIVSGNSNEGNIFFGDDGDNDIGKLQYVHSDNSMRFTTNTGERLRIASDGKIGIGIASPDSLLHLEGSGDTAKIKLQRTGTTIGGSINARDGSNDKGLTYLAKDGNSGYPMHVFQTDGGSGATERMRITHNGQLSIGAAQPTFNSPQPLLNIEKTSTGTGPLIFLYNHQSANTASTCEIRVGQNYREANRIVFGRENNNNWQSSAGGTASYMGFYTNSAGTLNEKLRIHSTGQVEFKNGSFSNNVDCVMANGGTMEIGSQSTIKLRTATNERLRINSNGQVTIGANYGQTDRLLYVETTHSSGGEVVYFGNSNSGNYGGLVISAGEIDRECRFESAWGDSFFTFHTQDSGGAGERMRISKSGQVLIGNASDNAAPFTTSTIFNVQRTNANVASFYHHSTGNNPVLIIRNQRSGSGGNSGTQIQFNNTNGSAVGYVLSNMNSTSFQTSSDYRLKENAVAISDGITRLKTLKPYRFNWKDEPSVTVDGFFAHEVTAVPEAISGNKDEVVTQAMLDSGDASVDSKIGEPMYQSIDQSKLVPLLTAALQEAITKIETLEARVNTLEGS